MVPTWALSVPCNRALLTELFDHPHPGYPWLVIGRREQHFIQSFFPPDGPVAVKHRRGGPDQHYIAFTEDRDWPGACCGSGRLIIPTGSRRCGGSRWTSVEPAGSAGGAVRGSRRPVQPLFSIVRAVRVRTSSPRS